MSHILVIDDDSAIRLSLGMILRRKGHTVAAASGQEEALLAVREAMKGEAPAIDLMLMDMNYTSATTGADGLELLSKVKVLLPQVPVILMTAWGSIPLAVEGVRSGAIDFVTKPWDNRDLLSRIDTALALASPQSVTQGPCDDSIPEAFEGIVGESQALRSILDTVRKVAPTDAPVLITGENGTGKELLARAIHRLSRRRDNPFVAVNLGGLPRSLFESEMFGHVRGAYTGADADRAGRFETAHTGTIFLDEIGDLDADCQVKMLRVLQEHTFERLGETRQRRVDIRVVCATNADLPSAVREGSFREDLFYRINLITLRVPPLRERREDIPLLVAHFAGPDVSFTPEAMRMLEGLPYPGNIRELRNLVKRLVIMSETGRITPGDIRTATGDLPDASSVAPTAAAGDAAGAVTLEELERRAITDAIARCGGNLSQVASTLGISRQSLYRRMEKFGLQP